MSNDQRLRRLEGIAEEQQVYEEARRLAEESGGDVEETTIQLVEMYRRIERYGWGAEIRRLAREFGMSEEEARAAVDAELDEIRREKEEAR